MTKLWKPLLAGVAFAALAGCGLRGGLERPDPIFGDPSAEALEPAGELPGGTVRDQLEEPVFDDPEEDDELLGGPDGE